jgi:phosphocarrier protein HPr
MVEKKVTIKNEAGIHCRPSSMILMAAQEFTACKFRVISKNGESDLVSILSLISMGLEKGNEITIQVEGPNAAAAIDKISGLFALEYDFPRE